MSDHPCTFVFLLPLCKAVQQRYLRLYHLVLKYGLIQLTDLDLGNKRTDTSVGNAINKCTDMYHNMTDNCLGCMQQVLDTVSSLSLSLSSLISLHFYGR